MCTGEIKVFVDFRGTLPKGSFRDLGIARSLLMVSNVVNNDGEVVRHEASGPSGDKDINNTDDWVDINSPVVRCECCI